MRRHLVTLAVAGLLSFAGAISAAHAAPAVEDYGKLPVISDVELSPSGDRVALVAKVDGGRRLFVKSVTTGDFLLSMPLEGVRFAGERWAGENHLILFTSITLDSGQGFGNTYLSQELRASVLNIDTHRGFDLFGKGGDLINAVVGHLSTAQINGHWYAYAGAIAQLDCSDCVNHLTLFRIDLDTDDRTVVARGDGLTSDWLVSPAGEVVARLEASPKGFWKVMTGISGGAEVVGGEGKFGTGDIDGFGRTASSILIDEPATETSFVDKIVELPLTAGAKPIDEELPKDPTAVVFDRDSEVFIGMHLDGDAPVYTFFDPLKAARFNGAKAAFTGVNVRLESANRDFSKMVVFTDGGDDSGTYWLVDITTGKASVLGAAYPTVGSADVGPTKMIEYKAADGLTIRAVLTLPPGRDAKNLPLIVMPHGGPIDRDRPGFDWWAQVFASQGYAVLQPNFRGSDGYGEDFITAGFGQWGRKMQTDLSDGIAYLQNQGVADSKRVCIAGASYGGFAALAGVTLQHGVYRCAIAFAPVTDLTQLSDYDGAFDGASTGNAVWDKFMGSLDNKSAVSPARFAASADAPVLMFHGRNDSTVPLTQSQEMDSRLRGAGKTSKLIIFPDEPHGMTSEDTRITVAKELIAWVEKYNRSDPLPAH